MLFKIILLIVPNHIDLRINTYYYTFKRKRAMFCIYINYVQAYCITGYCVGNKIKIFTFNNYYKYTSTDDIPTSKLTLHMIIGVISKLSMGYKIIKHNFI